MPGPLDRAQQLVLLGAIAHAQADEDVRLGRIGEAVVELGDVAAPEQAAELLEASGPLGDRGGEHRLARLAEVCPLGHEAQPVEVHVRAAEDGDEVAAPRRPPARRSAWRLRPRAPPTARRSRACPRRRPSSRRRARRCRRGSCRRRSLRARRNGSTPTCLTATPSANSPTCGSVTRRPARSERSIALASAGSTPTMRISGRRRLT